MQTFSNGFRNVSSHIRKRTVTFAKDLFLFDHEFKEWLFRRVYRNRRRSHYLVRISVMCATVYDLNFWFVRNKEGCRIIRMLVSHFGGCKWHCRWLCLIG